MSNAEKEYNVVLKSLGLLSKKSPFSKLTKMCLHA